MIFFFWRLSFTLVSICWGWGGGVHSFCYNPFNSALKPNSWTYNFVEVTRYNLESSRLEVSVLISYTIGKGVWFSIRFCSFLLYSVQYLTWKLKEVEWVWAWEREISRQSCRDCIWITRRNTLKNFNFVWISSRNSASGPVNISYWSISINGETFLWLLKKYVAKLVVNQ